MQRAWAADAARGCYQLYTRDFDVLVDGQITWQPYTDAAVSERVPRGLAQIYTEDSYLWLSTALLLYDIYIEPHCPDRVLRQFGMRQPFPLPDTLTRVTDRQHR